MKQKREKMFLAILLVASFVIYLFISEGIGKDNGTIDEGIGTDQGDISFSTPHNLKYIVYNDTRYDYPSESHIKSDASFDKEAFLTMEEMEFVQFYDEVLEEFVSVARNFVAGDYIYISDIITGISFNENDNKTRMSIGEYSTLVFEGSLTKRFNVGDEIKLKFKLIPIIEDDIFVTLNYNVNSKRLIEDYLVD